MKPHLDRRPRRAASDAIPSIASALAIAIAAALGGCFVDDGAAPSLTRVAGGLSNPTGLLVRADGTLLIAETAAGRVVALDAEGNVSTFVSDFAAGTFLPYVIGPLSLATLADGTLVVGEGGQSANRERISFFDVTGVELTDRTLLPVRGNNIAGLAIHPTTGDLYATSAGSNVVHRASPIADGGFTDPVEWIQDTDAPPISLQAPTGLAFDANGDLLVAFSGYEGSGVVRLDTAAESQSLLIERVYETADVVTDVAVTADGAVIYVSVATLASSTLGDGRVMSITRDHSGPTEAQVFVDGLAAPVSLALAAEGPLYIATIGPEPNVGLGTVWSVQIPTADAPADPDEPTSPPPVDEPADPPPADEPTDTPDLPQSEPNDPEESSETGN